MTTENLFNLIAKSPMMRTVQIADRLDMSVADVDELLRQGVQAGHVIEHEVEAPNNRMAMAYELSAQYMAANATKAASQAATAGPAYIVEELREVAARGQLPDAGDRIEAAPAAKLEAAPRPVALANTVKEPTVIERAIAYIRENGPSKSKDLHAALGIGQGVYLSSYLRPAVRKGKLVQYGQIYELPPEGAVAKSVIPQFSTIRSAPPSVDLVTPTAPVATQNKKPEVTNVKPFRCALWSDGTFEIQRNGATVVTLHPDEQSAVVETLQRAWAA